MAVGYLEGLTLTLTLTLIEVKSMLWKEDALRVEWLRKGTYRHTDEGNHPEGSPTRSPTRDQSIVMTMYSTFHFNGVKIKDQTIARDVNALNKQLGEMKEEDAEEIKEERIQAVTRALKVFEDETPNPNPNPNPNPD